METYLLVIISSSAFLSSLCGVWMFCKWCNNRRNLNEQTSLNLIDNEIYTNDIL